MAVRLSCAAPRSRPPRTPPRLHPRSALEQHRRITSGGSAADVSDALAAAAAAAAQRQQQQQRINFHVGVLHYTPTSESFPLLADTVEVSLTGPAGADRRRRRQAVEPARPSAPGMARLQALHSSPPSLPAPQYNPSTININSDAAEMAYWIGILQARCAVAPGYGLPSVAAWCTGAMAAPCPVHGHRTTPATCPSLWPHPRALAGPDPAGGGEGGGERGQHG